MKTMNALTACRKMTMCTARSVSENNRSSSQTGSLTRELPDRSCDDFVDPRPSVHSLASFPPQAEVFGKKKKDDV